jgi:DNA polymerase I-like protein with 3'-5' exonuclease and polymerase domains
VKLQIFRHKLFLENLRILNIEERNMVMTTASIEFQKYVGLIAGDYKGKRLTNESLGKNGSIPFTTVSCYSALRPIVHELVRSNAKLLALHVETFTSTQADHHGITLIGVAVPELPVLLIIARNMSSVSLDLKLRYLLQGVKKRKVCYDTKSVLLALGRTGLRVKGPFYDLSLMDGLLKAGIEKHRHSVDGIIRDYLRDVVLPEVPPVSIDEELTDAQLQCAARKTALLLPLYEAVRKRITRKKLDFVAKRENRCIKPIFEMQTGGISVDLEALEGVYQQSQDEGNTIITEHAKRLLDHADSTTGKIYAQFNQLGTVTGRITCSNPNLLGIPRDPRLRACIVPGNGHKFVIGDYSQIELRIAAEIAEDETMIKAFEKDMDLHQHTASLVTGKPKKKIGPKMRRVGKQLNFGVLYGMSPEAFRDKIQEDLGIQLSEERAQKLLANFFKAYKGVSRWRKMLIDKRPLKIKTIGGRIRRWRHEPKVTELLNSPIQGTAADILKLCLVSLDKQLQNTDSRIVCCVYDEIIIEAPEDNAGEVRGILKKCMKKAGRKFLKKVPVKVDVVIADSWAEK